MDQASRRLLLWLLDPLPGEVVDGRVLLEKIQPLVPVASLRGQSAPILRASSASVMLLWLVVGASTGETGAAVVAWIGGGASVLGVGSGCFFFLRLLKRLRRVLFTWAKASNAISKMS